NHGYSHRQQAHDRLARQGRRPQDLPAREEPGALPRRPRVQAPHGGGERTMSKVLKIGEGNRADTVRISDTGPVVQFNGSASQDITVREMIGGMNGWIGGRDRMVSVMRSTAKRAVNGEVFSTSLRKLWYAQGQHHATFEIQFWEDES